MIKHECDLNLCKCGALCQNQRFQKRKWKKINFSTQKIETTTPVLQLTITATDRFNWRGIIKNTEKSSISRRRRQKEYYETRVKKSLFDDALKKNKCSFEE